MIPPKASRSCKLAYVVLSHSFMSKRGSPDKGFSSVVGNICWINFGDEPWGWYVRHKKYLSSLLSEYIAVALFKCAFDRASWKMGLKVNGPYLPLQRPRNSCWSAYYCSENLVV
jgi:hypothetical protein